MRNSPLVFTDPVARRTVISYEEDLFMSDLVEIARLVPRWDCVAPVIAFVAKAVVFPGCPDLPYGTFCLTIGNPPRTGESDVFDSFSFPHYVTRVHGHFRPFELAEECGNALHV